MLGLKAYATAAGPCKQHLSVQTYQSFLGYGSRGQFSAARVKISITVVHSLPNATLPNTVPHVVTLNHKIILLLLHHHNFATVMNHDVNL